MTNPVYVDDSYAPISGDELTYTDGTGRLVRVPVRGLPGVPHNKYEGSIAQRGRSEAREKSAELRVVGKFTPPYGQAKVPANKPMSLPVDKLTAMTRKALPDIAPDAAFDNQIIDGTFTIFVLMYGDYHEMHRRCLESIVATVPDGRAEIRVGSNELCRKSVDMITEMIEAGSVRCHYRHEENSRKYPVMREMFHDPERPITTNYVVWFDDDTICNRDPDWLRTLATQITHKHSTGHRLFGPHYIFRPNADQIEWMRQADWFKGRALQDRHGNEVPNGSMIHFASGSFWALDASVIRECDIPDRRLQHNGGDYMIGEQVHQGGYRVSPFSQKKQVVNWSSVPRRGLSEKHAGKK